MKYFLAAISIAVFALAGCNKRAARDNGVNKSFTTGGANADKQVGDEVPSDKQLKYDDNKSSAGSDMSESTTESVTNK